MKLTTEWMETWFDELNRLYFKTDLPRPRLYVSRSKQRLGCLGYKMQRKKQDAAYDYRLGLTNYYVLTEWDYQNILLHEMIHLLIAHNGWRDTSAHGKVFRQLRDHLNNDCGWDIRISYNTRQLSVNPQFLQRKKFLVLAVKLQNGRRLLSVVNRKYMNQVRSTLSHSQQVASSAWYVTTDPYFIDFPEVRTPRGRFVSEELFDEKIAAFQQDNLFQAEILTD